MLQDHETPTPEQQAQLLAGRAMALTDVVAALIATHPDRKVLEQQISLFSSVSMEVMTRIQALTHDDGLRQGYSEAMRGLRDVPSAR